MEAEIRRRVEADLRNHSKYRQELKELLEEAATQSPPPADGQPKGKGQTGDPTYGALVRYSNNKRVKFLTEICETIDRCLFQLDKDPEVQYCKQQMVSMLYFRSGYSVEAVAQKLNYSRAQVYRWKAAVLEDIARELGYYG